MKTYTAPLQLLVDYQIKLLSRPKGWMIGNMELALDQEAEYCRAIKLLSKDYNAKVRKFIKKNGLETI